MKTNLRDEETKLPIYRGREAYVWLRGAYGLPNACPSKAEEKILGMVAVFKTRRVMFVDDENEGEPVAIWEPL